MPASRLGTPVLTVDTEKIHKVDTANAQSLHGMWMGKLALLCNYWIFMEGKLIFVTTSILKMCRLYGPRSSTRELELAAVDAGDLLRRTRNFQRSLGIAAFTIRSR